MPPRTWQKFVRANYPTEFPLHGNYAATITALSTQWASVKPLSKTDRLAARRAAAAQRQQQALPPAPTPPPEVAARGQDDGDRFLLASQYSFSVRTAGEHRPEGNDTPWRGGGSFKDGDDKSVVMWVRVDEDENIAERRVVKTVQVLRDVWLDATKWTGDVKDYQQRLPMDYHLQRKLCTAADGGEFFNRVRACVIDNEAWTYKLVLDYCDQGHVGSILRRYRDEDGDGNVPEPLAWSILEGLIKAVLVMQQGAIQSQEEDWKEVVHRDFKPDNVFLTRVPNSEYPRIQLSDFEHSIETTRDDPFNPKVWREDAAGHDAYWAPELRTPRHRAAIIRGYPEKGLSLPTIPRQDLTADKVCSTVNVWNIGTTMFTLMCGAEIRPVKFEGVDYPGMLWNREDMWWENWDRGALEYYSEELVQLVRNCLEDDPTMRPTPGELLLSVQAVSEDALCERRKGARGATADDVNNWDDDDGPMDYIRAADRYKIGLSFDTLATGEDLSSDWSVNASDEGS